MKTFERERRDWIIIPIILVVGFLCVIVAGQWALRVSPNWELNANMESRLDPNSDFLTRKPDGFIAPVDPLILTQPVWMDLFLTPGAPQVTRTPFPTTAATLPAVPTTTSYVTSTVVVTTNPTSTFVYFPPVSSSTPKPQNTNAPPAATPTNTSPPSANLQITKMDGVATYLAGGTLIYTVTVANGGPNAVTGALITDNIPAQITSWDWACAAQNGGASGCDVLNGNTNFSDTVNLPSGASIVYTVTANISPAAIGSLINTASVSLPAGYTDPDPANNVSTDTNSPAVADLQITKSDGATHYIPNSTRTYTIVVSNPLGPGSVNGATVTDIFPPQISSASWTCAGAGGAVCTANGTGTINDSVDLPVGSSATYTVNVTIIPGAVGNLVNTASVSVPAGYTDPTPANNSWTDTNTLITTDPTPGQIGSSPDGGIYNLASGSTLTLNTNIVVNGHGGPDLVYYELPAGSGILMDRVSLELSDGYNWYTIFNWGDNIADTNTNININSIGGAEDDNRDIASALLYNSTGVAIDLDGVIPNGTYSYIRITAPPAGGGESGDGCDVDAIVILP